MARVENGELLYVPVVTVHGTDHAHVYLAGQMARKVTGEIVTKGDMRAQIRTTCENIEKGLAYAGATFDDVVRATTYVTDIQEYTAVRMSASSFSGRTGPRACSSKCRGSAIPRRWSKSRSKRLSSRSG